MKTKGPRKSKRSETIEINKDDLEGLPAPRQTTDTSAESQNVPATAQDPLATYLREISKTPLLTPQEEKSLAIKVFEEHDKEAFQKLVQSNLRFVVKIAFEYAKYGARVLDLVQEGNMGLLKAVQDFNPYKDVRLTTYAVWWIRSYIQDFLLRNWSLVRIGTTAAQKKLFYRLKKEQEKFEREGLHLEPKALAMHFGVEESDVKTMQERLSAKDYSLSTPARGDDESPNSPRADQRLTDPSPLPSAQLEEAEQASLFKKALGEFVLQLDAREQMIFKDRLMADKPKTLIEIGDEYGFTKERARQLEERIKKKLKDFLSANYPDISVN